VIVVSSLGSDTSFACQTVVGVAVVGLGDEVIRDPRPVDVDVDVDVNAAARLGGVADVVEGNTHAAESVLCHVSDV
jgi:hypothetical protein